MGTQQCKPKNSIPRYLISIGYGSLEAKESAKRVARLLGRNQLGYNFNTVSLIQSNDKEKITMYQIYYALNMIEKENDFNHTSILIYLCLRGEAATTIDYQKLMNQHVIIDQQTGMRNARFDNYVVIIDSDQEIDIQSEPFHNIQPGTAILTMHGAANKASANGKYTYFSGLLVEAFKGGASNMFGMISLADLYSYLQEATCFDDNVTPLMKALVSESFFLHKGPGILHKREMEIFCKAFKQLNEDEFSEHAILVKEADVLKSQELQDLIKKLLELNLVETFQMKNKKLLKLFGPDSKKIYLLTAYGKHCQDMWNNVYFKYL